jgi:predicted metal-dependent hydrolase
VGDNEIDFRFSGRGFRNWSKSQAMISAIFNAISYL